MDAYFVNWLTQRDIDIDDVIKAFFSVVDPDGNDEDYFDLFEDYFRRAGFDSEDPEYIQVNYVCQRILEILLAQFNYTQAFSFLMVGSLMDVNVEDTYVVLTIKFEE